MQRRWHGLMAAIAAGVVLGGCASSQPMDMWQTSLERYVQQQGDGNPAVLTALGERPTRRTFSAIGDERGLIAPSRTDANGILIDHQRVDGELWFIYLVGLVEDEGGVVDVNFDRPVVREIRAVAFQHTTDGFRWAKGKSDKRATEQYLSHQAARWRAGRAEHEAETMPHTRFPRPYDRFELERQGQHVTIRHANSGAHWVLHLPGAASPVHETGGHRIRAAESDQPAANNGG